MGGGQGPSGALGCTVSQRVPRPGDVATGGWQSGALPRLPRWVLAPWSWREWVCPPLDESRYLSEPQCPRLRGGESRPHSQVCDEAYTGPRGQSTSSQKGTEGRHRQRLTQPWGAAAQVAGGGRLRALGMPSERGQGRNQVLSPRGGASEGGSAVAGKRDVLGPVASRPLPRTVQETPFHLLVGAPCSVR